MLTQDQITTIKGKIALLQEELRVLINPHTMTENESKIYTQARLHLGQHLTLNEAVPIDVGCMECVSKILSLAGYTMPSEGIAGTATGLAYFLAHPELFEEITNLEQGAILLFPTGTGNGSVEGHIFVVAMFGLQFPEDWGLMSNDSATGKLLETWSWERAKAFYQVLGGIAPRMFRAL